MMSIIDQLQRQFAGSDLRQLTPAEISELKAETPELPQDYLGFLGMIGCGNLGELQVYSGPISPAFVYPQPKGDLSKIVLIGDDLQGYCFGFDTGRQGVLVEVDPRGVPRDRSEGSFLSLVERFFPDESFS